MFHLFAVEIVSTETWEIVREQLVEAETADQARKLARDYILPSERVSFAYIEE